MSNPNDLTYLEKTSRDRIVQIAVAVENTNSDGEILVIFQMPGSARETLFFHQKQATELLDAFRRANRDGLLPALNEAEHDIMVKLIPYPTNDDFNMRHDLSRFPNHVKALVMTNAIVFDFVMIDGSSRIFALPLPIARFLGEYVEQAMRGSLPQRMKERTPPLARTLH